MSYSLISTVYCPVDQLDTTQDYLRGQGNTILGAGVTTNFVTHYRMKDNALIEDGDPRPFGLDGPIGVITFGV